MTITQNKLTPILVVFAALIVAYVIYVKATAPSAPVASGTPMASVPQPGVTAASAPKAGNGLFGGSTLPLTRSGDADNNAETLTTVTQSNKELRAAVQIVIDDNAALKRQNAAAINNEEAIAARVRAQLQAEAASNPRAPTGSLAANNASSSNPVGSLIDNGLSAATQIINGIGVQPGTPALGTATPTTTPGANGATQTIPTGLGYDGTSSGALVAPGTALTRVIPPLGYRSVAATGDKGATLVRTSLAPERLPELPKVIAPIGVPQPTKAETIPYFTIPENGTLGRSMAMTTLVGRVPIDGRVQDPMQFKLVVGRDNLAASGQYVPDDIAGVVISGIAVGDMALSCTEGLIQSMTFVFDDGTIRTVSQRSNGASVGFGSSGGGSSGAGGVGGQSLAAANKLGWISDEFGNPCIPGVFVTNAPAYLADVVGAKALSTVGAAIAAAQTTTTTGTSAFGGTTSSTVTGNQGRFVLGKVASAGSDEIVNWLTRRLNNSFDAVVVRAGTRVAVHIDQAIHIDKDPEGRKLDYARGRSTLAQQQGARYGSD